MKKNQKDSDFESQILTLFDTSPLHQFAKFNLGILIFSQKLFQFCTPPLKTPRPVLP